MGRGRQKFISAGDSFFAMHLNLPPLFRSFSVFNALTTPPTPFRGDIDSIFFNSEVGVKNQKNDELRGLAKLLLLLGLSFIFLA